MRTPFFNRFPYTNLNDINLDWIIKKVKVLQTRVDNLDPEDFAERLEEVEAQAAAAEGTAADALTTARAANTTANTARTEAQQALNTVEEYPADTLPIVDGTASAGTNNTLSRSDHVHPRNTENDVLSLNLGSISALPFTFTDSRIKSDMVVVGFWLSNPKNMVSYWTINTSDGSLTVSGAIAGNGTSCRIKLAKGV